MIGECLRVAAAGARAQNVHFVRRHDGEIIAGREPVGIRIYHVGSPPVLMCAIGTARGRSHGSTYRRAGASLPGLVSDDPADHGTCRGTDACPSPLVFGRALAAGQRGRQKGGQQDVGSLHDDTDMIFPAWTGEGVIGSFACFPALRANPLPAR